MNADKCKLRKNVQYKPDKSVFHPFFSALICGSVSLKIFTSLCLCGLIFVFNLNAQDLPDEIRGYKVHKAKVSVQTEADKNGSKEDLRVAVNFSEPELVKVTPLGTTFEVFAEMAVFDQSGKIDFLAFKDFRVNGLNVEIEEYREPFEIEKNKPSRLKKPVRIFVGTTQAIKGGLKEVFRTENDWQITGRVFVFGKFKKMGFKFKRVVPVDVNLKISNPLRENEQ